MYRQPAGSSCGLFVDQVPGEKIGMEQHLPIGEDSTPEQLVAWTLERFWHQRLVLTTSFGMEGCALIDMFAAHQQPLTVVYLDTMFLFPETYALRDRMVERYPHLT